jgi:DNA-binding response OmpR family regulator
MRILVVEDEAKLARAIKKALELQKYAVDLAEDGQEALDVALSEAPDLILLDAMLPKKDGFRVCRELRQAGLHSPILMLTAKGQIQDKIAGLDAGADDYMVKPFSFEELFARIRALLRRLGQDKDPVLRVADLELNPQTLLVKRAGKNVTLSTKEFAILEYLLRHKNSVISREQLLDHVWNYDAEVLPSTVEVHIKHLRDKIDSQKQTTLIETVRGFGYVIREKKV